MVLQKLEKPTTHPLVAATNNQHKISEIRPLIGPDFRILSLDDIGCRDELPETQNTLEGNSLQKAAFVYDRFHVPCFADDTGLEVEALNGAPGVFSARYAGEQKNSDDNIRLLLRTLAPHLNRKARFRTVITLVGLENEPLVFEGVVHGTILHEKRGTAGFGYDPVFQPDGFSITMAEMSLEEKNRISHRALAVKKLVAYLRTYYKH